VASEDINDFIMDEFLFIEMQLHQIELTFEEIATATKNDPELNILYENILLNSNKYGNYRIHERCILFGTRVYIPNILQSNILEHLHIDHVGVFKMIGLALSYRVYWPTIDDEIEEIARNCVHCNENRLIPRQDLVRSWEVPKMRWEKIHIDYAGPYKGNLFFWVVDEHSMWPEVFFSNSTSATNAIEKLNFLFDKFGKPKVIVSDTKTSFMEEEFQTFLTSSGIEHLTCVPYNAPSYENVGRFVFTLKTALIELNNQVGSIQDKLNTLLFRCRHSQTISTIASPAKLFLGQESNLDQLGSTAISNKVKNKNGTPSQILHYGQKVSVYNGVNGFIINVGASKYVKVMVDGKVMDHPRDKVIPFPVI